MSAEAAPKQPESRRSIIIVAVLCASFLWWWSTVEVPPEPVGPMGLVERALADLTQAKQARPLIMDFDLLEFSMCWLRAGKPGEAMAVAGKINQPMLQARAVQAIAQGYLGNDAGSMGPALKCLEQIADPALRQSSREILLLEIARMGFSDVAWEQAGSISLKAKILRTMCETDAQDAAAKRLPAVEAEILANPREEDLAQLAWAHLWLHHEERLLELVPKLAIPTQDEIYKEYFRMTRLESPEQAPRVLAAIPARLQIPCRLEAARLNGSIEIPAQFLASLESALPKEGSPEALAAAWLEYTNAQWQLQPEAEARKASAAKLESMLTNLSLTQKIHHALALSKIYYDALDLVAGHRLLESARQMAFAAATPQEKLTLIAPILEAAFRSGESEYLPLLLRDLTPDLRKAAAEISDPEILEPLLVAYFREGGWQTVMETLAVVQPSVATALITRLADLPVEATAGQGYAISQDSSQARFRQVATSQGEAEASKLAIRLKSGIDRGRAWLEIGKGLILKQVLDAEQAMPVRKPE